MSDMPVCQYVGTKAGQPVENSTQGHASRAAFNKLVLMFASALLVISALGMPTVLLQLDGVTPLLVGLWLNLRAQLPVFCNTIRGLNN